MRANKVVVSTDSPDDQLDSFFDKYEPTIAALARACRGAMRKRMPTANELVYDNYQFLAIGYSPTERTSECIVSLAINKHGVALSFYYGATLDDPDGVLLGTGKQNRFIRLPTSSTLTEPAVESRIDAAIRQGAVPLTIGENGKLMIKSISAKQVPRR